MNETENNGHTPDMTPTEPAAVSAEPAPDRHALNRKNARSRLYAVLYFLFAWFARLIHNLHVHGKENEPRRGETSYLVICNHLTWRDPILLCAALRQQQPHFMAKKELFRVPVLRSLIRALGAYPVDRGGADAAVVRNTIRMLENGTTIGMFPQGHRYNGKDPRKTPVRSGCAMMALRAGVPVLPVFIKVKNNTHKTFCRKDVYIGKPVYPEEFGYDPTVPGEYARITAMLFEKACALGDEAHD